MTAELRVFRSLREALDAGFAVYDRTPTGFTVRKQVDGIWFMVIVDLTLAKDAHV